jgi:predicted RNA-binding protein with PUA-like domain
MWLLKTEPSSYSYADLAQDRQTRWNGVKNPAALKNMRAMKVGDEAIIYHTGGERAAVGISRIIRAAYPDPDAGDVRRLVVDLESVRALRTPVALAELKKLPVFEGSPLLRQGRLSVVPLTRAQWSAIEQRGG